MIAGGMTPHMATTLMSDASMSRAMNPDSVATLTPAMALALAGGMSPGSPSNALARSMPTAGGMTGGSLSQDTLPPSALARNIAKAGSMTGGSLSPDTLPPDTLARNIAMAAGMTAGSLPVQPLSPSAGVATAGGASLPQGSLQPLGGGASL